MEAYIAVHLSNVVNMMISLLQICKISAVGSLSCAHTLGCSSCVHVLESLALGAEALALDRLSARGRNVGYRRAMLETDRKYWDCCPRWIGREYGGGIGRAWGGSIFLEP